MNIHHALPTRVLRPLILLVMLVGCSSSGTSTDTSTDVTGSASSTAATMNQSLMDQVGGVSGANRLADAFGANLSANPTLSASLNTDAINGAKQGLVNEIAKASGTAEPYAGASLLGSLSGKGLTADSVNAITSALSGAADSMNLPSATKTSLLAIMEPVSKALVG